jgi:2-phosphoglycerate kinase
MSATTKRFILIWWAPTTGKSTLAQNLSNELHLPWISTDQIRLLMKIYAHREETWGLFLPEWNETAEKFLNNFSTEEIVDMEFAQAHDVWPGVQSILDTCYTYVNWCIIEGVNISPETIHLNIKDRKDIFPIIVVDDDIDRIREVIYTRGLFDDANKYSDVLKEKEVDWVSLYIQRLKTDCEKYSIPYISTQKSDQDVHKLLPLIHDYFSTEKFEEYSKLKK